MHTFKRFIFISLFLLLIPITGFLTSIWLTQHHNEDFYQFVGAQTKYTKQELKNSGVLPQTFCKDQASNPSMKGFCIAYEHFDSLKKFSQAGIILGIGLLVLIKVIAFIVKFNTQLYALLFSFFPLIAMLLLSVSVAIQTIILSNTVFLIKLFRFHQNDVGVIESFFIIGMILFFGTLAMAFSNVEGTINQLRFKPDIDDEDSRRIFFYPVRLFLEECSAPFVKKTSL